MSSTASLLTVHNHLNSTSFSGRSPCHPFILPAPQWPQTQSQEEWLCPTPVPSARAQLRAAAAREDWWGSAQPCQAEGPGGAPVAAGKGGAASCVQQDGGAAIGRDATKPGQGCASAQVHFYTYRNTRAHAHTHTNVRTRDPQRRGSTRRRREVLLAPTPLSHHELRPHIWCTICVTPPQCDR